MVGAVEVLHVLRHAREVIHQKAVVLAVLEVGVFGVHSRDVLGGFPGWDGVCDGFSKVFGHCFF